MDKFDLTDFFWSDVSGTHDTQRRTAALAQAKVAAATWWPFLSSASSEKEFEDRLSLVSNKIEAAVGTDTYEEVLNSLRDDYRAVHEASEKAAPVQERVATVREDLSLADDDEIFDAKTGRWERAAAWYRKGDDDYDEERARQWDTDAERMGNAFKETESPFGNGPHGTYRDQDENRRTRLAKSERGINDLGHDVDQSSDNPYTRGERKMCVACNGWGKFESKDGPSCGHCGGKGYLDIKKKATNYQPDPNAGWRYHQPYEQLREPVNNGALQDSDGFPDDLAQGEYDAANQRMQFQLTPGTWTEHDGMPERPMPQGAERGYRPVNASLEVEADYKYVKKQGDKWVITQKGTGKVLSHHDSEEEAQASFRAMMQSKHSTLLVDRDGFLVEASDVAEEGVAGRANSPLVDPAPGTPQRVNPYYFNDDAAMGANDGFPVQPSPDPVDRVNEIYGDAAPATSVQDTSSSADGNGYSRSHPGESPDFNSGGKTAARHSAPDAYPYEGEGYPSGTEVRKILQFHSVLPGIHDPHGLAHGLLGLEPQRRHNKEYMDAYNRGAAKTNKTASTDGKIVDHCPGCSEPRRVHATPHGDEIRHLHNNHVRCHGDKTARVNWGDPTYDGEEPRSLQCWDCNEDFNEPANVVDHVRDAHGREPFEHDAILKQAAVRHPLTNTSALPQFFASTAPEWFGDQHPAIQHQVGWIHGRDGREPFHDNFHYLDGWVQGGEDRDNDRPYRRPLGIPPVPHDASLLPQFFDPTLSNGSVHTADYLGRPDARNPTGRGEDEYEARNWDAYSRQRPMQSPEDRGVNTPVLGREPLRTRNINTPTPGLKDGLQTSRGEDEEDDDDDE